VPPFAYCCTHQSLSFSDSHRAAPILCLPPAPLAALFFRPVMRDDITPSHHQTRQATRQWTNRYARWPDKGTSRLPHWRRDYRQASGADNDPNSLRGPCTCHRFRIANPTPSPRLLNLAGNLRHAYSTPNPRQDQHADHPALFAISTDCTTFRYAHQPTPGYHACSTRL
jgi:hypothetical protein